MARSTVRRSVLFVAVLCAASHAYAATPCAALADVHLPAVEITSAVDQPAGPFKSGPPARATTVDLPAHCLVRGVIEKRIGVGGKPYGINFELRLPGEWNHRFLFEGGGGTNGVVAPAIGSVKGPAALTRGFAVVTQDAGHQGRDSSFGEDQQSRLDMIYRSYDRVTGVAKAILAAFYGKPADKSYFMGCSEGGREALLAVQRLPLEYDGVVAGDPGFLLGASLNQIADHATIVGISPKGADGKPDFTKAFSPADLALVAAMIDRDCDAADGLKDGLIDDSPACRPAIERLACRGAKADTCLSKAQVGALRTIFDGGRPTGHHNISAGYFFNTAIDQPAWRGKLAGTGGLPGGGVNSIQGLFVTPYDPGFDDSATDFAKDGARFDEVAALNRADGVMVSSFKARGGKLLIYTGTADQAFSAKELIAYFWRLRAANGGAAATADFARLFLVSGMTHCRGGKALDTFDPLSAVVEWVEKGKAPVQMTATGEAFPGRSRPLCAFPTQTRYTGTGSIDDAANFECRIPAGGVITLTH